jgi:hypothetical protein
MEKYLQFVEKQISVAMIVVISFDYFILLQLYYAVGWGILYDA